MPLSIVDRLDRYEIRGFLGAGRMGEVYRAHDRRLDHTSPSRCFRRNSATSPTGCGDSTVRTEDGAVNPIWVFCVPTLEALHNEPRYRELKRRTWKLEAS